MGLLYLLQGDYVMLNIEIGNIQINFCNSILGFFYTFRRSFVHHQEDHLYMQCLYGIFFMHLCKQSSNLARLLT